MQTRESSEPYCDLIDDFDLVVSSFQSQYGIRLSRELNEMKWDEFRDLFVGLGPDTPLGRIIAIRSEKDKDVLKHFTKDQKRIHADWKRRCAKKVSEEDMEKTLEAFKNGFIEMAGGIKN